MNILFQEKYILRIYDRYKQQRFAKIIHQLRCSSFYVISTPYFDKLFFNLAWVIIHIDITFFRGVLKNLFPSFKYVIDKIGISEPDNFVWPHVWARAFWCILILKWWRWVPNHFINYKSIDINLAFVASFLLFQRTWQYYFILFIHK